MHGLVQNRSEYMKICIGLSGGVDSSVAALLLKKQGYDVFGLFMQNWHDASTTLHGECEWEEDRFVAEMVARKIGIPFYFVDLSKVYRERVVDYMFDEYAKGRTPNPDVLCNREIKFAAFWETAKKLGADMVATGHYCRKDTLKDANGNEVLVAKTWGLNSDGKPADGSELTPIYRIFEGSDPNKDQSYFLCQLTQEQLSTALFPIGDIDKPEVRRIAHEADLPSADKKDSQGICFVGKVDLPTFLKQKLEPKEGNVVEVFDAYYEQNAQYQRIESILTSLLPAGSTEPAKMISDYVSETKTSATDKNGRMAATTEGGDAGKTNICPWDLSKLERLSDEDWEIISRSIDYSDIHFETEVYRSGKKHVKKTRWKENPLAKIVGTHDGAQFYTIGQRKGLNIGGHSDSIFVIGTDIENNIIYVGEGHRHKGLSRSCLRISAEELHWIREDLRMTPGEVRRYRVRIRYRQPLQEATLVMREKAMYVLFDQPQRGITPGQFAVWYAPDDEMLGSGVI
ncbi:MAG: tRNA 2-thiouridine(34) synthase MnmA [Bacteroidales bacterium]|nr:tRNA 2-thiouridine(34) synthase MnmA [Bacteroidales bacterium]